MKAEADRRAEAQGRALSDYTSTLLRRAHGAGVTQERTRSLAANCKILPPLPPGQAVDPNWAPVYANAAKATIGGHGHSHRSVTAHGSAMHM